MKLANKNIKSNQNALRVTLLRYAICCFLFSTSYGITAMADNNASLTKPVFVGANQTAVFRSDLAECAQQQNNTNTCTYLGHAYFSQGNIKLWGPTIKVDRDSANKIIKLVAIGDGKSNQGHYYSTYSPEQNRQGNDNNGNEPLDAQADIISLYPSKNLMTLDGHAQVKRKHDTMLGSYIEYDTNKQTVLTKPAASERTIIIMYPAKQEQHEQQAQHKK